MHHSMEFAAKMASAYSATCKPLCQELKLPQTAFDILLFLANNPNYKTASDIVEIRKIKANLVSVNVEKLVKEGYLKRQAAEGGKYCFFVPTRPCLSSAEAAPCSNPFLNSCSPARKKRQRNSFLRS